MNVNSKSKEQVEGNIGTSVGSLGIRNEEVDRKKKSREKGKKESKKSERARGSLREPEEDSRIRRAKSGRPLDRV